MSIEEIKRDCLRFFAAELGRAASHRTAFDERQRVQQFRDAVKEACGPDRAAELFPASSDTIRIRKPTYWKAA